MQDVTGQPPNASSNAAATLPPLRVAADLSVDEASATTMSSISSSPSSLLGTGFNVITEFPMEDLPPVTPPAPPSLDPVPENEDIIPEQKSVFDSIPPRPVRESVSSKYSPLPWEGHFDEELKVAIPDSDDVFHLYLAGSEGPVVFCLHGGGYTGLSFALIAGKMKDKVRVVAMDMRGHGLTYTSDDSDLSAETQCEDVLNVISSLYGNEVPAIILVGHRLAVPDLAPPVN